MSLTRKLLKELELNEDAVERIIAAHVETVDALRQERDAALSQRDAQQAETASAREALSAFQAATEQQQRSAARRAALASALAEHGANPQATELLLDAITLPEESWDGAKLLDARAAMQRYQAQYPGLFARKNPIPVTRVSPPISGGGALTHADVKRMSASDINRNWSAVKTALNN